MVTLPEVIILWYLFTALQFPFDYIAQHNNEAKRERVPRNKRNLSA